MIAKMADHGDGDPSRRNKLNGLSNHDKDNEYDRDIDATLNALLASSLLTQDADSLHDLGQVAAEYTSLNNTIDELNRYLDRLDERHEQLREHIREAKLANEKENENAEEEEENDNKVTVNIISEDDKTVANTERESTEVESSGNEERSQDDSDGSI